MICALNRRDPLQESDLSASPRSLREHSFNFDSSSIRNVTIPAVSVLEKCIEILG
jgi:hypothetical protein